MLLRLIVLLLLLLLILRYSITSFGDRTFGVAGPCVVLGACRHSQPVSVVRHFVDYLKLRLHQRKMLRATSNMLHVARNMLPHNMLLPRNMLRWCERGLRHNLFV